MEDDIKDISYVIIRFIEIICVATVIFGVLWEGTETFNLTMPQFLMLYGGIGALVSEILARILSKKKSEKEGVKHG